MCEHYLLISKITTQTLDQYWSIFVLFTCLWLITSTRILLEDLEVFFKPRFEQVLKSLDHCGWSLNGTVSSATSQPLISIQKPSGVSEAISPKIKINYRKNWTERGFQANLKTLHTSWDHHKIFNNVLSIAFQPHPLQSRLNLSQECDGNGRSWFKLSEPASLI